jgi:nucleoside-diphosphate-sugar epimerase
MRHLNQGDQVRFLSRRSPSEAGLPNSVNWFLGDLSGTDDLQAFADGADVLYHCAGEIGDESRMEPVHVFGTRRLVEAASGRIGRWVQLSSTGAYGQQREGIITEHSPLNPRGMYEVTKVASDALVKAASSSGAFEHVILRPSIVYGAGMPNQSLYSLIYMIQRGWFFSLGSQVHPRITFTWITW